MLWVYDVCVSVLGGCLLAALGTFESSDELTSALQATTDIPCITFVDELFAAYPGTKVSLTHRDVDSWLKSMERSFYEVLSWRSPNVLTYLDSVR